MLELVRRCNYCASDMTDSVSSSSYRENPFCSACAPERIKNAIAALGPFKNRRVGDYLEVVEIPESNLITQEEADELRETIARLETALQLNALPGVPPTTQNTPTNILTTRLSNATGPVASTSFH